MDDITDILAEIRHEIKTPVNIISSNAELISKLYEYNKLDNDDINERMKTIRFYCKRIESITDSILSASKLFDGKSVLNCTFGNIEDFFATFKVNSEKYFGLYKAKITVKPKVKNTVFCCDYSVLEQIVMNLVTNAIKYNKSSQKRITITVEDDKEEKNLIIKIKDNGIGIDENEIEKIFDKFYRCEKGKSVCATGTGLGLFVVKNLITALGGTITAESPKTGTEFIITLPRNIKVSNKFCESGKNSDYFHENLIKSYLTSLTDYETAKQLGLDF